MTDYCSYFVSLDGSTSNACSETNPDENRCLICILLMAYDRRLNVPSMKAVSSKLPTVGET